MTKNTGEKSIVLFDGTCVFCNACVQFILRHKVQDDFLFFPLQSEEASSLLKNFEFHEHVADSMVLIENNKVFLKSTAALRISGKLNLKFRWLYVFMIIPRFLRDRVYDWIANGRHRWMGKIETCAIPDDAMSREFSDQ